MSNLCFVTISSNIPLTVESLGAFSRYFQLDKTHSTCKDAYMRLSRVSWAPEVKNMKAAWSFSSSATFQMFFLFPSVWSVSIWLLFFSDPDTPSSSSSSSSMRAYWWQGASHSATFPFSNSNSLLENTANKDQKIFVKTWNRFLMEQEAANKTRSWKVLSLNHLQKIWYWKIFGETLSWHLWSSFFRASLLPSSSEGWLKTKNLSKLSSLLSWQISKQPNFQKSRSTPSWEVEIWIFFFWDR